MQAVREIAAHAAHALEGAAHVAGERAVDAAHVVEEKIHVSEHARQVAENAKLVLGSTAESLGHLTEEHRSKLLAQGGVLQAWLNKYLRQLLQAKINQLADGLPQHIKDALEDPLMPRCVSRFKDKAVEVIWPDIKEELMLSVAELLDGVSEKELGELDRGPDCIRAFLRYHIFPFDKSIWGKLRDPYFVIFLLASLIPWAGMTPLMFFFVFLIIDHRDEYQLCAFILQFKGTQFISLGIIRTLVGYIQYIKCVTAIAQDNYDNCNLDGPGITDQFEMVVAGMLLQIVLIWVAFLLLPYSKEKGRRLKGDITVEHASKSGARGGGYMGHLLVYDMICFLICCGIMLYTILTRPQIEQQRFNKAWVVRQIFFACQIMYGYLSLPFFFCTLPVVQAILTHAVPTAYDSLGRCVKLTGPPKPPREPLNLGDMISAENMHSLLDGIRRSALGLPPKDEDLPGTPGKGPSEHLASKV